MGKAYHEEDYRRVVESTGPTRFLPGSRVEIVRELTRREPPRHVLLDFDGTLSLIREGWPEVMVPMMVEVLRATGTRESPEGLRSLVFEFIMQLNGKQTIYQMIRLAEEVRRRGGSPLPPLAYKQMYHERLMARIADRREALRAGQIAAEAMLVPGALELLAALRRWGVALYLASGTDERYVREEARLLGLDEYFGRHVYGAIDDYQNYSKAMVIERILRENRVEGAALLGFGDGYVEIQNVKAVGGIAVAVASDEAGRSGRPDAWKRDRLIGVGADIVIPDYRDWRKLLEYLWLGIRDWGLGIGD
jgi:phosphoglycolate phosphatase-like HAD superfamily hydrolase